MKRKFLLVTALLMVLCVAMLCVVACETDPDKNIDPDKQSIAITNGTELTAKWNVGEPDRTVQVQLSEGLQNKEVTLTAEPADIVTIDGMKLTAAKQGDVTITATVKLNDEHVYTDSVEISVKYNYTLTISNKADLTKAFRVSDADRTLEIVLSDAIKDNAVVVTSSNADVISVDGKAIHAVGKGEATITATSTLNGVSFTDSVKVKVWGAFDLTVDNLADFANTFGKTDGPVEIKYTLVEAGDYTAADVAITSSNTDVAVIENGMVKILAAGTTEITVACGGVEVKFTVTVEVQPILEVAGLEEGTLYTNTMYDLPAIITAVNAQDQDVSSSVEISGSQGLTVDAEAKTFVAQHYGKYTLTYKFTDAKYGEKSVEYNFDIIDKLVSESGAHVADDSADMELGDAMLSTNLVATDDAYNQYLVSGTDDLFFAKLFGGEASTYYYAEVTFDIETPAPYESGTHKDTTVALAHFSATNGRLGLISELNTRSTDFLNVQVEFNKYGNIYKKEATSEQTVTYCYKIYQTRHLDLTIDNTTCVHHVTLAIARVGDFFYTFLDGHYVNCITYADFRSANTVPAIVGVNFNGGGVKMSDIVYLSDKADVDAKLFTEDGLLGVYSEKIFVPYAGGNDTATGSYKDSFSNTIDTSEVTSTGFNYPNTSKNFNGSCVSPYIFFDGNFTIQWDYQYTGEGLNAGDTTSGSNTFKVMFELRDFTYGNESIQMGSQYGDSSSSAKKEFAANECKMYLNNSSNGNVWIEKNNDYITKGDHLRFTLTRIIKDDHAELIITAAVLNADGSVAKTYTRVTQVTKTNWNRVATFVWHNPYVSGIYSNFKWSVNESDVAMQVATAAETTVDVTYTASETAHTWQFSLNDMTTSATISLADATLATGKYNVTLTAVATKTAGNDTKYQDDIYTAEVTIGDGAAYLELTDITLPYGTYKVTLTPVEPEPSPAE